jgi:hypothetical protein
VNVGYLPRITIGDRRWKENEHGPGPAAGAGGLEVLAADEWAGSEAQTGTVQPGGDRLQTAW